MTPEPGTPMVPLSVADAARDVSPGCAYTWAELEGAAVPWPATPAARDDHHPAEPLSEAIDFDCPECCSPAGDYCTAGDPGPCPGRERAARRNALRAAATPTTPAGHVPVPIDALETLLASYAHGSGEVDPVEAIAAFDSLRAALTAAQQDTNT